MPKLSISRRKIVLVKLALVLALLAGMSVPETCLGQGSILSMFKRKTPPSGSLELQAEHGPWLILAATFSGDSAQFKAETLAKELRSQLRQPAFVMQRSNQSAGVLLERERVPTAANGQLGAPKKLQLKYANQVQRDSFAVLVGEFTSTSDPSIDPLLEKVRTLRPASLDQNQTREAEESDLLQKTRSFIWRSSKSNRGKGPLGAAFVTKNPLLPDDFFQTALDDFVEKLNKQVKHSLLDCPGKFTVRVASFYGYASTQLARTNDGGNGDSQTSDALDKAAENANKLTVALRKKGVEAYQFHDRVGSYVTVGSFDKLGTKGPQGTFHYNPAMLQIMQEFCGYRTVTVRDPRTGAVTNSQSLNSLEKIPFDIDGKPLAVPRRETGSIYARSLLGT